MIVWKLVVCSELSRKTTFYINYTNATSAIALHFNSEVRLKQYNRVMLLNASKILKLFTLQPKKATLNI